MTAKKDAVKKPEKFKGSGSERSSGGTSKPRPRLTACQANPLYPQRLRNPNIVPIGTMFGFLAYIERREEASMRPK